MSTNALSMLPEVGGWGLVGFAVGFVVKKMIKWLLILVGVYFGTLLFLQQKGWITINRGLDTSIDGMAELLYQRADAFWAATAVSLPVVGAFGAGAYLGFRKG